MHTEVSLDQFWNKHGSMFPKAGSQCGPQYAIGRSLPWLTFGKSRFCDRGLPRFHLLHLRTFMDPCICFAYPCICRPCLNVDSKAGT